MTRHTDDVLQISLHRIPVRGGLGALTVILILLLAMAVELPGVRWLVVLGPVLGLVAAVALVVWRRPRGTTGRR